MLLIVLRDDYGGIAAILRCAASMAVDAVADHPSTDAQENASEDAAVQSAQATLCVPSNDRPCYVPPATVHREVCGASHVSKIACCTSHCTATVPNTSPLPASALHGGIREARTAVFDGYSHYPSAIADTSNHTDRAVAASSACCADAPAFVPSYRAQ